MILQPAPKKNEVKLFKHLEWSNVSVSRNNLTIKYEPIQPYIFMAIIKRIFPKEGGYVFDVGANIGAYGILAASVSSVLMVFAFEAEQEAYNHLCKNIKLNNMEAKVEPRLVAVSNSSGEVSFGVSDPVAGINGVLDTTMHKRELFKEKRTIHSISLDSEYSFTNEVLLFKIDVEGHESAVIQGATNLFKNNKCILQIEIYRGQEQGIKHLSEMGYKIFFKAGPDHYLTNFDWNPEYTIELMQQATQDLITYNTQK